MKLLLVSLFALSIGCDVAGQIFFKVGAGALPLAAERSGGWRGQIAEVLGNRWLLAGIATYAVETVVWLRILADVPISIAFPIASLNFLGVAFASRWLLRETLSGQQWAGAGLVTIGVVLVAGGDDILLLLSLKNETP